jgi:hypothetical protein
MCWIGVCGAPMTAARRTWLTVAWLCGARAASPVDTANAVALVSHQAILRLTVIITLRARRRYSDLIKSRAAASA